MYWKQKRSIHIHFLSCVFVLLFILTFASSVNANNFDSISSSAPSSTSFSTPELPSCTNEKPAGTPQLYEIKTTETSATLYFVPVRNVTGYAIFYGFSAGDNHFATRFDHTDSSGAVSYTINALAANTTYYFRIYAQNGCMPGNWGNTLSATTKSSVVSGTFQNSITSQVTAQANAINEKALTNAVKTTQNNITGNTTSNSKPLTSAVTKLFTTPTPTPKVTIIQLKVTLETMKLQLNTETAKQQELQKKLDTLNAQKKDLQNQLQSTGNWFWITWIKDQLKQKIADVDKQIAEIDKQHTATLKKIATTKIEMSYIEMQINSKPVNLKEKEAQLLKAQQQIDALKGN